MNRWVSKGLQFLGIIIVTNALFVGLLAEENAMTKELQLLLLGGVVFMVGYWLEDRGN